MHYTFRVSRALLCNNNFHLTINYSFENGIPLATLAPGITITHFEDGCMSGYFDTRGYAAVFDQSGRVKYN